MNKKDKIILFDLDGTLIDSTDAITDTFLHAFSKHNFDFIRGNILYTTSKLKNLKKQSKSSITKELKKHLNS